MMRFSTVYNVIIMIIRLLRITRRKFWENPPSLYGKSSILQNLLSIISVSVYANVVLFVPPIVLINTF